MADVIEVTGLKQSQVDFRVQRMRKEGCYGLSPEGEIAMVEELLSRLREETSGVSVEIDEFDMGDPESVWKQIQSSLKRGLKQGNAPITKLALEYMEGKQGEAMMSNFALEIVPYTISDTSLANIVLWAEEEVVAEIEAALLERRRNGKLVEADGVG